MRPGLLLSLVVVTAATGFAPVPEPRPNRFRDDLSALQGAWTVTKYESGGRNILAARTLRVKVDKQRWQFLHDKDGTRVSASYEIVLNPEIRPRSFDWRGTGMPAAQFIGSYQLDGDTITIIFTNAGNTLGRPTNFVVPRTSDYIMVLKRGKS
jgi:uncharacterized protein (TIGR03067 family)